MSIKNQSILKSCFDRLKHLSLSPLQLFILNDSIDLCIWFANIWLLIIPAFEEQALVELFVDMEEVLQGEDGRGFYSWIYFWLDVSAENCLTCGELVEDCESLRFIWNRMQTLLNMRFDAWIDEAHSQEHASTGRVCWTAGLLQRYF